MLPPPFYSGPPNNRLVTSDVYDTHIYKYRLLGHYDLLHLRMLVSFALSHSCLFFLIYEIILASSVCSFTCHPDYIPNFHSLPVLISKQPYIWSCNTCLLCSVSDSNTVFQIVMGREGPLVKKDLNGML